jgi:cyclopropane fatty-acyl-phospholipid synthase-like methyltransferase
MFTRSKSKHDVTNKYNSLNYIMRTKYFAMVASLIALFIILLLLIAHSYFDFYVLITKYVLNNMKHGHLTIYSKNGMVLLDVYRTNEPRGKLYTSDFNDLCKQLVKNGDTGIGELYMQGKLTSPDMLGAITTLIVNDKELQAKKITYSGLSNDKSNIKHSYDIGNNFYMSFLKDDLQAYTCGFFLCDTNTLNEAQYNKIDSVIRKLEILPNECILDVGCGWGSIANYVGKKTNSIVDGLTIADEQQKFINTTYPNMKVFNKSYADVGSELYGKYDKIYSIGMFEHVRCVNYDKFFSQMSKVLKQNGRFLLHTITYQGKDHVNSSFEHQNKSFISEYIFPGGQIPTHEWVIDAASKYFKIVHIEVYPGQHYSRTLEHWRRNLLESAENLRKAGYNDELLKMYEFYFLECEAAFSQSKMNITHFLLENGSIIKDGIKNMKNNFMCNK